MHEKDGVIYIESTDVQDSPGSAKDREEYLQRKLDEVTRLYKASLETAAALENEYIAELTKNASPNPPIFVLFIIVAMMSCMGLMIGHKYLAQDFVVVEYVEVPVVEYVEVPVVMTETIEVPVESMVEVIKEVSVEVPVTPEAVVVNDNSVTLNGSLSFTVPSWVVADLDGVIEVLRVEYVGLSIYDVHLDGWVIKVNVNGVVWKALQVGGAN